MTADIDDTPEPIPDQLPPEWKWLYEKGYNAGLRATEAEMLNQQHDITRLQANLTAEAEARIAAEAKLAAALKWQNKATWMLIEMVARFGNDPKCLPIEGLLAAARGKP